MKFSWRDVFDTNKKHYGFIDYAAKTAKEVGYDYFCWNGWIYDLNCKQIITLTNARLVDND